MLLCMAFMYPLLRRYPDMMAKLVFPLAAIFIMGYFAYSGATPANGSAGHTKATCARWLCWASAWRPIR